MNPIQQPPASTPPEPSSSNPVQPPAASGSRKVILTTVVSVWGIFLLASGAFVLLADWLAGWQLTRPWLQVSATVSGILLLVGVAMLPTLLGVRRLLMAVGGLLLLLAVADSLDGQQDFLPQVTIFLTAWAFSYAETTTQLLQMDRPRSTRRWLAVCLGILATAAYLATAGYYFVVNLTTAPVVVDHHPLYGFGIVISLLLGVVGEIHPYGGPLTGKVRICAACGLRNIPERQICKRCRAELGPVEYIA